jgi:hypothetical protein
MYVLVKEMGEYSGFSYEIIAYYDNIVEADYAVKKLEYENKLKKELARLTGQWTEQCDYMIEEIKDGKTLIDIQTEEQFRIEKQKIDAFYKVKLEEATLEKTKIEKEKDLRKQHLKDLEKQEVLAFWEWWNHGSADPFFDDKKQAKIRDILPKVKGYLINGDSDIILYRQLYDWYHQHSSYPIDTKLNYIPIPFELSKK